MTTSANASEKARTLRAIRAQQRREASDARGLPTIVLFQRGSARLSRSYADALRRHVLYLEAYGHVAASFVLRGHANLLTDEPRAVKLSAQRSIAVADFLRQQGIPARRIKVLARGSERPWDIDMGGAHH